MPPRQPRRTARTERKTGALSQHTYAYRYAKRRPRRPTRTYTHDTCRSTAHPAFPASQHPRRGASPSRRQWHRLPALALEPALDRTQRTDPMTDFTPWTALAGGLLIGAGATARSAHATQSHPMLARGSSLERRSEPEGYRKGTRRVLDTHTHTMYICLRVECVCPTYTKGESYATVSMTVTLKAGARKPLPAR